MSTVSDFFSVERGQDVWTFRFRPLDFMIFQRPEVTDAMFALLAEVEASRVKVIRADYPDGTMSPAVVDRFWDQASRGPLVPGARREPPRPTIVRNVSVALPRLLNHYRRTTTFAMVSFQGEVDMDLLGVLLTANYRVCSEDTVIVNRVLDREAAPGSGAFWFLTRHLGYATANHILTESKSLSAQEAFELQLVNRVVSADELEQESQSIAEQFAAKPSKALASFVRSSHHLDADLATYLERIGSGFGA